MVGSGGGADKDWNYSNTSVGVKGNWSKSLRTRFFFR